ncbi:Multimodular transpeptidase-transglycosylase [hydrothermal vent metagenome]|uniref:peptidoglycan glycosyltransferase n=1 Tax=hydrothermal vent metagenome TaxID=652676 RepID=A0A3B1AC87_9ZZZZ
MFKRHLIVITVVIASIFYWQCLPQPLFDKSVSTVLLDRNNQLLSAHIATDEQWRFPTISKVPEKFEQAILTFEDKRFNYHPGVDPMAMARALYLNISNWRTVSGGSTISMQVIRLARDNPSRTVWEKLKEVILATRLEFSYSKDEILALYASNAPYGGNVVGLEAASWRYFGRTPEQLSWAENATLAVLPNSPALIHPGRNRSRLKAKRDALLASLYENKILTDIEYKLAVLEPLPIKPKPIPHHAPHLLSTLMRDNDSARIKTTLLRTEQIKIERLMLHHAKYLSLRDIHNLAALVVDNDTFEVVAYVGNSQFGKYSEHGHAIDIIHRPRSSGSILKPLLYARMIQSGEILPDTLIADMPTQYSGYMPENYDREYRGAVPAKLALARSLNVPAVRMLRQHGVSRFYNYLQKTGMRSLSRPADDYGLTLILGGAEANLWDMASIYANLAATAKLDRYELDARYKKIRVNASEKAGQGNRSQISPATAWLTMKALMEVSRPGTENHWREFNSSRKVAWKTGTSFGLRDAWAIGSDTRYTVAVWVGNASGEGIAGLTGVSSAAPIMFDIFNKLDKPEQDFRAPLHLMKRVQICKDNGYLSNANCASKEVWIPRESHFQKTSPHHRYVHLDKNKQWQVNSRCESVNNMKHVSWFELPPGQAYYYKQTHSQYRPLPKLRADCRATIASQQHGPIDILYPLPGTRIYIPTDLASQKSRTIFEAVHRQSSATLFWHLDEKYLGATENFHNLALNIKPGKHVLTVVDDNGFRVSRRFEVLGRN